MILTLVLTSLIFTAIFDVAFLSTACIIAYNVLYIIGVWKIFNKMGEGGWKSIIPFYNDYILYKHCLSGKLYFLYLILTFVSSGFSLQYTDPDMMPGYAIAIVLLVGLALLILDISLKLNLSRSFGHGVLFMLGLIFFEPIFMIILGFNSDSFVKHAKN